MDLSKHKRFPGWERGMPLTAGGMPGFAQRVSGALPNEIAFAHNHPAAMGYMWEWAREACRALDLRPDMEGDQVYCLEMVDGADGERVKAWGWSPPALPAFMIKGEGSTFGEQLASLIWQLWDRLEAKRENEEEAA